MIQVAAAIIENEHGLLLIAKRKQGKAQEGLWEFPGGKLEKGESAEACLQRELLEEMNIHITPYEAFGESDYVYGDKHIQLLAYRANFISGEILLVDHDQYEWVHTSELIGYEFAPADIPFVKKLSQG